MTDHECDDKCEHVFDPEMIDEFQSKLDEAFNVLPPNTDIVIYLRGGTQSVCLRSRMDGKSDPLSPTADVAIMKDAIRVLTRFISDVERTIG
jgi:hypothetical protein